MLVHLSKFVGLAVLIAAVAFLSAQQSSASAGTGGREGKASSAARPEDTEVWEPVPAVVTPAATDAAPPSDAIVLFDGKNLDQWVSSSGQVTREMDGRRWRDDGE